MTQSSIWLSIGFLGQSLFSMRFFVQWIVSERSRKSVVPKAFWYFSILGGVTLLTYAIHQRDLVFMVGQASGLLIYGRNVMLTRQRAAPTGEAVQC